MPALTAAAALWMLAALAIVYAGPGRLNPFPLDTCAAIAWGRLDPRALFALMTFTEICGLWLALRFVQEVMT